MTGDPSQPDLPTPAPQEGESPVVRRRVTWPWVVLFVAVLLGLLVAFAPVLFGQWVLSRLGPDFRAGGVSGPLWSPTLRDAQVKVPGVNATAGQANVTVTGVDIGTRTVHLGVAVNDATVNLRLKDLFAGGGGGAGGAGWKVVLDRVDVQDTRVNVDGQGVNIPNGAFTVRRGENGRLAVQGRTSDGQLNADVQLRQKNGANVFIVDVDADARVLNHYWPGVTAGRITGQYTLGDGPVRGDLNLRGGALRVPQAAFVTVTGVAGHATHRGDNISLQLEGRGWNGPVRARGGVDLKAHNWTVTADASPSVAGLAQALGTVGEGQMTLRVTAGGWSTVRVKGYAKASGSFARVPFTNARAEYTFLNQDGQTAGQTNDVAFSAVTALAGRQRLQARWALGREGRASWVGDFGSQPLNVQGRMDARNVLSLSGEALGGPLDGTLALQGTRLNVVINPDYGEASARVALTGTPENLRAEVRNGQLGPVALSGLITYNERGLKADLGNEQGGRVNLDLNRELQGAWEARNLRALGGALEGQGRLNLSSGDVTGRAAVQVPGVPGTLTGPLNVNYVRQRGSFRPGRQVLTWNERVFGLNLRGLPVAGGLTLNGDLNVTNDLRAYGVLSARGQNFTVRAVGQGRTASLTGTAGGVTVQADTTLQAPFRTTARLSGADVQGTLRAAPDGQGVAFTLVTAGDTARGQLNGNLWDVSGRVNLGALRPLLPGAELGGTLDLNLAGLGGGARVNARALGAQVSGTLRREDSVVTADAQVTAQGVTSRLAGRVYPDVGVRGTLSAQGQTLNAAVSGPYGTLRAAVTGRTTALTLGGVTVPAQAVNLRGTLTPALSASGTWGNLRAAYDARGGLRLNGSQGLTAFGRAAQVQGSASWAPGFQGQVNATGTLDGYTLNLVGPWQALTVQARSREGLRASGTASLPAGRYDLQVRGPLPGGLSVQGRVQGQGAEPRGTLRVFDAAGGSARVNLRGLSNFEVQATGLTVAGQQLQGQLRARNNLLSGTLRAGPLTVLARDGRLSASGEVAGQQVQATGRLTLPATVSDLQVKVTGPYFTANAAGDLGALRGTLRLNAQTLGAAPARVQVPAQVFPLTASVTGLRAQLGGLRYENGRWAGAQNARYLLNGVAGRVQLVGAGAELAARPSGPLTGRVTLLPALGGTVSTSLSPLLAGLPAQVRREIVAGRLNAQLSATGAVLTTTGTRYLNDPLNLNARLGWARGLTVAGELTHPGSRLPLRFDGRTLTVSGASLDARTLRPVLAGAQGRVVLDLNVPDLNFGRASGRASVNIAAQGQRAAGLVRLSRGQLSADLTSTLAGVALRVAGPLYPQANAVLSVEDVRGTLTGSADTQLTLRASGTVQGRALNLSATGRALTGPQARVDLNGTLAGAALSAAAQRGPGRDLSAWAASGSLNIPDLRALAGTDGQLRATLGGTLADLRLNAAGTVAGVAFQAPARYRGGQLRVDGAAATLPAGQARVSGLVFPTLALSAKATLNDLLPGAYTAQVNGTLSKPDVNLQGVLRNAPSGLQAGGSRVTARLFGRDWKAQFTGAPLAGTLRGVLGSNAAGGLQTARLTVHAPFVSGETRVRLDGAAGWNTLTGWNGSLRAVGDIPGGPLDAVLDGRGALHIAARVGEGVRAASLTGTLGAGLPLRPAGQLNLQAFDVGALWGRAGQLRVTGDVSLAGATWAAPEAAFQGRVLDAAGDLTGDLGATYRAGDLSVRLVGPRVAGGAVLRGDRYEGTLRAETLRLARLLPAGLDVDALTFAGTLEARGSLRGGPERVTARNLALRGDQGALGPFSLYGSATYAPGTLDAALSGSLRSGLVQAQGSLPAGVQVTARDLPADVLGGALGRGTLNGTVTLRGEVTDPTVSGTVSALTDRVDAQVTLAGRVRDPQLHARATLKGGASGTLYADASELNLAAGTLRTRVYGTVRQGGVAATLDLGGVWPRLSGAAQARVQGLSAPVTLRGDGQGNLEVNAGALGTGRVTLTPAEGLLPRLSGTLNLRPLALLSGAQGELNVAATLGGTLLSPTVAGSVSSRGAGAAGVTVQDVAGSFAGTLAEVRGTLTQGGRTVATLTGPDVQLNDLRLNGAGSALSVTGRAALNGTADVTVAASGTLDGSLVATLKAGAVTVRGSVGGPQGLRAAVDAQGEARAGWRGSLRLTGGPAGVLTQPAQLTLSGPFARPLLQGEAGVLGAGARLVASADGVQLRLVDGPGAAASGVLEARPDARGEWRLGGAASLTRPELSLNVTPSGPLSDPSALLSVRRGDWRASGTVGARGANLSVTDGERNGTLVWAGPDVQANLPGLNLARLNIADLGGTLSAQGRVSTNAQDGQVTVKVTGLNTPYTLPYLGVDLDGEVTATVTLQGGRPDVQGTLTLPAGTLTVTAAQGASGLWTGRVGGGLARDGGTLSVAALADAAGLTGTLNAARFPLDVAGQNLRVDGQVRLLGQTFAADLVARNTVDGEMAGQARVDASGGIADLLPALSAALPLRPTEEGYGITATLSDLDVKDLKIAPALSGRVSGEANLRDGGGTFLLRSDELRVGSRVLPARLEGTQVAGDWRIRGLLGQSEFTAGLTGGEVFGQGNLRALPLGAVVAAFTGATPGEGVVTGLARFRFPLADPLAGSATVVAERIRVSATSGEGPDAVTETLTGTGSLDFAARELRNINVQLSGAGTWDVRGQYTRHLVDLTAQFTDTTFTPVLQLVPGLADLDPSLKGTLTLSAAGTYDRPRGLLRAQNLRGAVAGLSLQVPAFAGDLPDSGAFTGSGRVLTGGTVGADVNVNLRGQLTLGQLSGTVITAAGLLAPEALGALPNTTVTLAQASENRWTLDAQSRSTNPVTGAGTLSLTGTVTPRWDLTLAARNYNLPLAVVYGRESALNADLRAVDDGEVIRVSGAADFARLTLGRVNAPDVIPAPGRTRTDETGRRTDDYNSPLPEAFSTFPRPAQDPAQARPALPLLERLVFEDIPIRAPNGIRVDESLARAEFTGNLLLSGTGARPLLRGDIVAQRGVITLRENEFNITQGTVNFSGQGLYPSFNLNASGAVLALTTRQRVPVTLSVAGNFVTRPGGQTGLELTTVLSCAGAAGACNDPDTGLAYSEAELYALVATGVPNLTALPDNLGALGTSALQTALNVFVLGELERSIAQAFGLDVFRFTPQLLNADGSVGATITLGSYLTRDLYLQYQVDLTGQGLIDATYSTPDNRFTFKVSTPLTGLNLQSIRPSFSAAYNINPRTSVSIGVENSEESTKLRFGVTYRIGGR